MKQVTKRKRCENHECDGQMVKNGMCYTTYPARYGHTCNKCKLTNSYIGTYPCTYLEFEEQEQREEWE